MGVNLASDFNSFIIVCLLESLYIIIPLIVLKKKGRNIKFELKNRLFQPSSSKKEWILRIGSGIIIGIIFYGLSRILSLLIYEMVVNVSSVQVYQEASEGTVNTLPPIPSETSLVIHYLQWSIGVLFMFGIIAVSEEFFYRGIVYREYSKKHGEFFAITVSSIIFALYHVFPGVVPLLTLIVFFPYYFTFGVVLALLARKYKGDLTACIISHGLFNSILWTLYFL